MLGKIFGSISLCAIIFGLYMGRAEELSCAVIDGAGEAVSLALSLCGIMALWCGVMRVLEAAGAIRALSKLLMPVIRVFFPDAAKSGEGVGEISSNIAANLLGIGNAATPFALAAMKKLQSQNPVGERATSDMITLAVLNTAPLTLLPTTVISLLRANGASRPYALILPIWRASLATVCFALTLTRIMRPKRAAAKSGQKRKKHTGRDYA